MKVTETDLPEVKLIEPRVFGDERGWFLELRREERYHEHDIDPAFLMTAYPERLLEKCLPARDCLD